MRKIELYTSEDANKDLSEGLSESEAAIKKWESIVFALEEIERVALQGTPLCEKYAHFDCSGCPLVKYDFPCNDSFSTFALFYTELKKLRMIAENMLMLLYAAQRSEEHRKSFFV